MTSRIQEHITTMADAPPFPDASTPFDDVYADIILRSSDAIDLKVFQLLLSMGSPFFKDMLLSMCYPMGAANPPTLDKLEDVDVLLEAAIKYGVERVEKRAREMLVAPQHLRDSALRVFAIACRHKLEGEARAAARATLSQPISKNKFGAELEFLSAAKLFRLIQYHEDCVAAVQGTFFTRNIDLLQWLAEYFARSQPCAFCDADRNFSIQRARLPDTVTGKAVNLIWLDRASLEALLDDGRWTLHIRRARRHIANDNIPSEI
ncbi:hypothetical protein HWV62_11495 [Athelia sp. TMB]|nr:hypothetical protein HWV62_11495 [Athelia sp. TMB]